MKLSKNNTKHKQYIQNAATDNTVFSSILSPLSEILFSEKAQINSIVFNNLTKNINSKIWIQFHINTIIPLKNQIHETIQ